MYLNSSSDFNGIPFAMQLSNNTFQNTKPLNVWIVICEQGYSFFFTQSKENGNESNEYSNLLITVRGANKKTGEYFFFYQKFLYIGKLDRF